MMFPKQHENSKYTVSDLIEQLSKYNRDLPINIIVMNGQESVNGQLTNGSFAEQVDWKSGKPILEITLE